MRDLCFVVLIALAALACWGCSGGEDRCNNEIRSCDIRDRSCQEQLRNALACMRGEAAALPPVRVITEDELRAMGDDDMDMAMDVPSIAVQGWRATLQMLGMLPVDEDRLSDAEDEVYAGLRGFYRSDTDEIFVVDRGDRLDGPEDVSVFVHELVHAQQWHEGDIDGRLRETETNEGFLELSAAIEGEATFYDLEAYALLHGVWWNDPYPGEALEAYLDGARSEVAASAAPYLTAKHVLRYPVGAMWTHRRWRRRGDDAARGWPDELPGRSAEMMCSAYPEHEERPCPSGRSRDPLRCPAPPPPEGFEQVDADSLGGLLVYAFLHHSGLDGEAAWGIAARLQDDGLWTYVDGADPPETATAWRLRFQTAEDAEAVMARLDRPAHWRLRRDEDAILLLASRDNAVRRHWTWSAEDGCGHR